MAQATFPLCLQASHFAIAHVLRRRGPQNSFQGTMLLGVEQRRSPKRLPVRAHPHTRCGLLCFLCASTCDYGWMFLLTSHDTSAMDGLTGLVCSVRSATWLRHRPSGDNACSGNYSYGVHFDHHMCSCTRMSCYQHTSVFNLLFIVIGAVGKAS